MKKKYWFFLAVSILFSLTLFQCKCGHTKNDIPKVDTSKINITFNRFDKEFQQSDTANTKNVMPLLQKKYGYFYDVYVYNIMHFGNRNEPLYRTYNYMNDYFMFSQMRELYNLTQDVFPNTETSNEEIKKAFAYYKNYFPKKQLPTKINYCITGLNYSAFISDSEQIGVSLDMYLNKDTLYNQIFPNYIAAKLRKEMICQNVMKTIYNDAFGDPYKRSGAVINCMIEVGKQQYYLEKVMPHILEEYRFGYSEAQLKWCENNEKEIWKFLADKDLFYNESEAEIRHFIGDQANTPGMPTESPGNIGAWIGYRIVSAYMEEMSNQVDLETLLNTDPKTILAKSKYKP